MRSARVRSLSLSKCPHPGRSSFSAIACARRASAAPCIRLESGVSAIVLRQKIENILCASGGNSAPPQREHGTPDGEGRPDIVVERMQAGCSMTPADLHLDEGLLQQVRVELAMASELLVPSAVCAVGISMQSITGIRAEVCGFLDAARVAGEVLSQGARLASSAASDVLQAGTNLDQSLAASLTNGVLLASKNPTVRLST